MNTTKTRAVAAETIETTTEVASKGFEKTMAVFKGGMEKAAQSFELSQVKFKESVEKTIKSSGELVAFSRGNLEAFMAASTILAAGLQGVSKSMAASSKASIDASTSFTKTLIGIKSIKEAVDLQSGFVRFSVQKAISETSKVTDASVKLAEEAIAPLTARLTLAVEKLGMVI